MRRKKSLLSQLSVTNRASRLGLRILSIKALDLDDFACPVLTTHEILLQRDGEPVSPFALNIGPELTNADRVRVEDVVQTHYLNADFGVKIHKGEMEIRLTDTTIFHSSPRRLSYHEKAEAQKILDSLLEREIIRPSHSPYASAVVLVKKKKMEKQECVLISEC